MAKTLEVKKNQEIEDDEIDLFELLQVLIKRKTIIIALFLFATILGTTATFILPKVYEKEFIINTKKSILTDTPFVNPNDVVVVFGDIIKQGMLDDILPDHYKMIADIKMEVPKNTRDKVKLTIQSTNKEKISEIGYLFVNYMNESIAIKEILNVEKEKLDIRYDELNKILKNYDQDSSGLKKQLREGRASILGFNPLQFDANLLDFKIQKSLIEKNVKDLKALEIIYETIPDKPIKPNSKLIIIISMFTGLIIGIFLALFLEYFEKFSFKSKE